MLEIVEGPEERLIFTGRFDAAQVDKARRVLQPLSRGRTLDFAKLDYISSAGLGILLATQQRLAGTGEKLILINANSQIRDVFHFSGFDQLFEIR
ncbi:MAG TPA: STAS domain-containing protein [Thermoanaerobaculia bacterium]|nr:STAS domain-containing protein [Thermoanaerobaculia bacterium]